MKTPTEFRADQFRYSRRDRCFVAEASSLGLKPHEVPGSFTIRGHDLPFEHGGNTMVFDFSHREFSGHGDDTDIAGWRYTCSQYAALIIND